MKKQKLSLFEAFGIEVEYMIVDKGTLKVAPIADKLIMGEVEGPGDVERGEIAWCNELARHVVELKTHGPRVSLSGLPERLHAEVGYINQKLDKLGAMLLPTAMHPSMDPHTETQLWPHDSREIYDAFNSIFDCRGHGWSNLQSTHINLPFQGDEEFGKLHAATRLVLPLLPAIAASSPIVDGRLNGTQDNRLQFYRNNAMRVPSVSGQIIPEGGAYTRKDYEMKILARIYQDLSPFDAEGTLQHEWVNARGAIARFERDAIEIRLLDVQECPTADVAIAHAVVQILKDLVAQKHVDLETQKAWGTAPLATILRQAIVEGPNTVVADEAYLRAFGLKKTGKVTLRDLWQHLMQGLDTKQPETQSLVAAASSIAANGTLSERIVKALGKDTSRSHQEEIYRELSRCLLKNQLFAV